MKLLPDGWPAEDQFVGPHPWLGMGDFILPTVLFAVGTSSATLDNARCLKVSRLGSWLLHW